MTDEVADRICEICASRPDLLKPEYRNRENKHALEGFCYIASEAYFHAKGGYDAGYTVWRISHEGDTHWFLKDPDGQVVDLTAEQFESPVPHGEATKTGFLTREPSQRAQKILSEMECC